MNDDGSVKTSRGPFFVKIKKKDSVHSQRGECCALGCVQ